MQQRTKLTGAEGGGFNFEAANGADAVHPLVHLLLAEGDQVVDALRRPQVKHVIVVFLRLANLERQAGVHLRVENGEDEDKKMQRCKGGEQRSSGGMKKKRSKVSAWVAHEKERCAEVEEEMV